MEQYLQMRVRAEHLVGNPIYPGKSMIRMADLTCKCSWINFVNVSTYCDTEVCSKPTFSRRSEFDLPSIVL